MSKVSLTIIPEAFRIQDKRFELEEKTLQFSSKEFQNLTNLLAGYCASLGSPNVPYLLLDVGFLHMYCTMGFDDVEKIIHSTPDYELIKQYKTYLRTHWKGIKSLAVYIVLLLKERNYTCKIYRHNSWHCSNVITLSIQVSLPDITFENNPELTELSKCKQKAIKLSLNAIHGYKNDIQITRMEKKEKFDQQTNADWSGFSFIDFANYQALLENNMIEEDYVVGSILFQNYVCDIIYHISDDMLHISVYHATNPNDILSTKIIDDAGLPCTYDDFQNIIGDYLFDFMQKQHK